MPEQETLWRRAAQERRATALAHPNIAFIKYWGNQDDEMVLPANPSLSMNLAAFTTVTTVAFDDTLPADTLTINQTEAGGDALARVGKILDLVRQASGLYSRARVESVSNVPMGAGIASSAAAFAALSLAASAAAGLPRDEAALSRLARRGSGSACRSVPGGFCRWDTGDDESSVAVSIAPAEHWALWDVVAVVSEAHKQVGSSGGHPLAATSDLHPARIAGAGRRVEVCQQAILARDLAVMGPVIEEDAVMMHAVMMTGRPPLYYWTPATMALILAVQQWREDGIPVYFTIDAGPNVHCICPAGAVEAVAARARRVPGVQRVITSGPGGPARLVPAA